VQRKEYKIRKEHLAFPRGGSSEFIHCLQIELEFGSVDFCGGKKKRSTRRKTLGAK